MKQFEVIINKKWKEIWNATNNDFFLNMKTIKYANDINLTMFLIFFWCNHEMGNKICYENYENDFLAFSWKQMKKETNSEQQLLWDFRLWKQNKKETNTFLLGFSIYNESNKILFFSF